MSHAACLNGRELPFGAELMHTAEDRGGLDSGISSSSFTDITPETDAPRDSPNADAAAGIVAGQAVGRGGLEPPTDGL